MAKRKTDASETLELFRQAVDLRTKRGREAWETIQNYYKTNQTTRISLLRGLALHFPGRPLDEILDVDPTDYQRNIQDTKCVCGQSLSREVYVMKLRGRTKKKGLESQVKGKIQKKTPVSRISTSAKTEFFLGKDCYAHFPELLSDFGYKDMQKTVKEARKKKENELEELVTELSAGVKKKLRKYGIDEGLLTQVAELLKNNPEFTEQSLLFGLDPGKKNSFANWFREGIQEGSVEHQEVIGIYEKLMSAAHLVEVGELAALVTYAYEYRSFETKAVIGGVKDDLLYLEKNEELATTYGKPNLDKHFVRPATRFRERKGLEKVTIREKLDQSHITLLEGLGVKLHFPNIEEIRVKANREIADQYGVAQAWHYLMERVKHIFEEVKGELAEEYKEFGEIVNEHVLTEQEYKITKGFLHRSRMGRGTERENYLRMFSIRQFAKVAPVIVAIGRKVRYAEELYERTEDDLLRDDALKQDYLLQEEVKGRFAKEGIEEEPDQVIAMLAETCFVEDKNFLKFQQEHAQAIQEMYGHGLLAGKYLKPTGKSKESALKRNLKRLQKEGVK